MLKYLLLACMVFLVNTEKIHALELRTGITYHLIKNSLLNDRQFNDDKTTINFGISQGFNDIHFLVLYDSFSYMSFMTFKNYEIKRTNSLKVSLNYGLYVNRLKTNEENLNNPWFIDKGLKISINKRKFALTPIIGLESSFLINKDIHFNILITPGFIYGGFTFKLF